jgi:hypothetical protein
MAFTQTELDALKAAYASGALEVRYADKTVRYDSADKLLERIRIIEKSLNGRSSGLKALDVTHSKGLD